MGDRTLNNVWRPLLTGCNKCIKPVSSPLMHDRSAGGCIKPEVNNKVLYMRRSVAQIQHHRHPAWKTDHVLFKSEAVACANAMVVATLIVWTSDCLFVHEFEDVSCGYDYFCHDAQMLNSEKCLRFISNAACGVDRQCCSDKNCGIFVKRIKKMFFI